MLQSSVSKLLIFNKEITADHNKTDANGNAMLQSFGSKLLKKEIG